MSKWYVTVGFPGGEFASRNSRDLSTERLAPPLACDADFIQGMDVEHDGSITFHWAIREAPPALAEWLDWGKHHLWQSTLAHGVRIEGDPHDVVCVPGGWLCAGAFIPVANANGITVIAGAEEAASDA